MVCLDGDEFGFDRTEEAVGFVEGVGGLRSSDDGRRVGARCGDSRGRS